MTKTSEHGAILNAEVISKVEKTTELVTKVAAESEALNGDVDRLEKRVAENSRAIAEREKTAADPVIRNFQKHGNEIQAAVAALAELKVQVDGQGKHCAALASQIACEKLRIDGLEPVGVPLAEGVESSNALAVLVSNLVREQVPDLVRRVEAAEGELKQHHSMLNAAGVLLRRHRRRIRKLRREVRRLKKA